MASRDPRREDLRDDRRINKQATTILLVEQNATTRLAVSNRGYVLGPASSR